MRRIIVSFLILTSAFFAAAAEIPEEQAVRQTMLTTADRMAAMDFDGVLELLAEEYVEIDEKGEMHTRADLAKQISSASTSSNLALVLKLREALQNNDLEKVLEASAAMNGTTLSQEAKDKVKTLSPAEKEQALAELKTKLSPVLQMLDAQFAQLEKWKKSLRIRSVKIEGDRATVVATQQKFDNPRELERSTTTLVKRNGKWLFAKSVVTTGQLVE